jgi:eukaryotic-like serine/threonine-protein kinase
MLERYERLAPLSSGGARVYAARDRRTGERVAIKRIEADRFFEDIYWAKQEYRAARSLRSPFVVPVYELVIAGRDAHLVMPLIEGEQLGSWARRRRGDARALERVLCDVACGLADLEHADLVHRDIKPSNVLVTADGRAVIVDFGFAVSRVRHEYEAPSMWGESSGTPDYMPPEAMLCGDVTTAQDAFAFGATAFEAIAGHAPRRDPLRWTVDPEAARDALRAAMAQVDPELVELIVACLATEPSRRPSPSAIACELARLTGRERAHPAPLGSAPKIVGRCHELSWLRERIAKRVPRIAVLGPSGIGKTTLIQSVLEQRGLPGEAVPLVLAGRCHPGEQLPYRGLDEVADALCCWLRTRTGERTVLVPPEALAILRAAFPVLTQLLRSPERDAELGLEPRHHRRRLGAAFARVLEAVHQTRPTIVWLDDVHWLDEEGARLLRGLSDALGEAGPTVIASGWRLPSALADWSSCSLQLGPLDPAGARALLLSHVAADDGQRCAREAPLWQLAVARGNPALLGHLARERQHHAAEPARSVLELVQRRVDRLPADARALVQYAAAFSQPLPMEAAQPLCSSAPLRGTIHALESAGLVRLTPASPSSCIEISHESLREAIIATIAADARQAVHAALAMAVEPLAQVPPQLTAFHHAQAGHAARAGALFVEAGKRAVAALAFDEAAGYFRKALALQNDGTAASAIGFELAQALALAGRAQEAADAFAESARAGAADGTAEASMARAAEQYLLAGQLARGLALLQPLLRPFPVHRTLNPRLALLLLGLQPITGKLVSGWLRLRPARTERHTAGADAAYAAVTALSSVDPLLAAYFQDVHLRHARASGDRRRLGRALLLEAGLRGARGVPRADVDRWLSAARGALGDHTSPKLAALVALVEATTAWSAGAWATCVEAAQAAERLAEHGCVGAWWEMDLARAVMLDALRWSGRYLELSARLERYLDDANARDDRFAMVTFRLRFGSALHLVAGLPDAAWQACNVASDWSAQGVQLQHLAEFHARAETLLYMGRADAALDHAERALARMRHAPLLLARAPRAKAHHQLAACKLACAAQEVGARRAALVQGARRDLRQVWAAGLAYTDLLADALAHAADALLRRPGQQHEPAAAAALQARARSLGMPQLSAALALLTSASLDERRRAHARLRELGVAEPARWASVLVPGLGAQPEPRCVDRTSQPLIAPGA